MSERTYYSNSRRSAFSSVAGIGRASAVNKESEMDEQSRFHPQARHQLVLAWALAKKCDGGEMPYSCANLIMDLAYFLRYPIETEIVATTWREVMGSVDPEAERITQARLDRLVETFRVRQWTLADFYAITNSATEFLTEPDGAELPITYEEGSYGYRISSTSFDMLVIIVSEELARREPGYSGEKGRFSVAERLLGDDEGGRCGEDE
ncbi:MAG: hypothetical protein K8I27_06740 [Planctomycetes bacterium]|nr:hypothetical protein [Planctomycetota bacterium]